MWSLSPMRPGARALRTWRAWTPSPRDNWIGQPTSGTVQQKMFSSSSCTIIQTAIASFVDSLLAYNTAGRKGSSQKHQKEKEKNNGASRRGPQRCVPWPARLNLLGAHITPAPAFECLICALAAKAHPPVPSPLLPWFNIFIGVVNSNGLVRRASGYLKTEAEGLGRTQSGEEGLGRRSEAAGCHIERDFAALGQGERKRKGGSGSCARLDGRNGSSDDELQLMMQIPGFALPLSFPLSLSL